jgi:hypothetical protein
VFPRSGVNRSLQANLLTKEVCRRVLGGDPIVGCANQAVDVDVALLVDRPAVFIGVKIDS